MTAALEEKVKVEIDWIKCTLFPKLLENTNFRTDNLIDGATDNVKLLDVQLKFIGVEEAFMLTTCYRAIIKLQQGDKPEISTTIVVKKTPNIPPEVFDNVFRALFSNEIVAYNNILPGLEKFTGHRFNVPRFYYGDLQNCSAIMVMKDFVTDNFRMAKQKVNLSLEHALVALKNLGTFHGTGFALKHKNPAEFKRLTQSLREPRYDVTEILGEWAMVVKFSAERLGISTRKYLPHIEESFINRYCKMISEYLLFGRKMVAPVEPLATLCHGDYLRNNIAFKYAEVNGTEQPIDSLMFDMQTVRISSPMLDFATFLSLSTYTAVRQNHFDEIFDEYYTSLVKAFKENTKEEQIPEYFSRESLLREYWRLLPYSISIASHFLFQLVEPMEGGMEEMFARQFTIEEVREDTMCRGGEETNLEITQQIRNMYDILTKHNIDIFKGVDYV
uniref:CHK kinase-like domain-containing protein n=1 Tax=Bactrocera latifrons TaxID=174628 RepID=A0A0K8UGL4_BACLA